MKRPRLNNLRTFAAAGRFLSFSRAAEDLNITQAAVSQQMRQLETYLGEKLFVRHHRRLSLTGQGAAYLDAVHEALGKLDLITDQLFPRGRHQTVIIRCNSSVAVLWLAPKIRSFQTAHPDIDLQIRTLESEGEVLQVANADLEIFVTGKVVADPDVVPLLTSAVTPVTSPAYLDARQPVRPHDVSGFDLIHILGYDDDWQRWFHTFDPATIHPPRGLAADSSLFAIDAALRGDGVFLGRRPFIDAYLESGDLVEVFAPTHSLQANYYLRKFRKPESTKSVNKVAAWLIGLAG